MNSPADVPAPAPVKPTFKEALRFWFKLGLISFGGPSGQIAIMHTELVDKKRWISESRFLHALNYCMLLPGPEAQQLATYSGWLLHGTWGGVVAGVLFVLPAAVLLWILSVIYVAFGEVPWISAFFYGLKPAVIAIVAAAVWRVGSRALKTRALWTVAALSFVGIYFLKVPFPAIVLGAAVIGWIGGRFFPKAFRADGHGVAADQDAVEIDGKPVTLARTLKTVLICAVIWLVPVMLCGWALGWNHTLAREALFFSKAALITFGGAYAVLPYVAQQAVDTYGWLTPLQMLDGLALAETTPGPLIMVLQFVGFLGGYQHPGGLPPFLAATLGAALTTWVTFAPSFLFIFAGAPHIERLRHVSGLTHALSAITAAVVGVILNLAVWFAVHAVFTSMEITTSKTAHLSMTSTHVNIDFFVLWMSVLGLVLLQKAKLDVLYLVPLFGVAGIIQRIVIPVWF